jgi:cation diffusion facilitator family transporter
MPKASRLNSPYVVMAVVLAMYSAKAVAKLAVGSHINSPMITGDGFHNLADIFVALLVVAAVWISKLPPDERYPFGRKNVESIARLAIGGMLIPTALHFGLTSIMGLVSYAPGLERTVRHLSPIELPTHEPLLMGTDVNGPYGLWWILGITGVSALLSFLIGRYEIVAGKANGHASMVADGKETRSDGLIEIVIFVGVIAEYLFHAAWLEYPLGIGVAALVGRTGWELWLEGWHALLQHSLGREVEDAIRRTCTTLRGVDSVEQVTTFRVGSRAVVILKLLTRSPAVAHDDLKKALKLHLTAMLAKQDIEDAEFHLRFSPPPTLETRIAYAVMTDGKTIIVAPDLQHATHFIISTSLGDETVRWTLEQPPSACQDDLVSWLEAKRVVTLRFFGDRQAERHGSIIYTGVPAYDLRTLGLEDLSPA